MLVLPELRSPNTWLKFDSRDYTQESKKAYRAAYKLLMKKEIEVPKALNFSDFGNIHCGRTLQELNEFRRISFRHEDKSFSSQAWNRLFRIQEPVICEYVLEFLSTISFKDHVVELDVNDTINGNSFKPVPQTTTNANGTSTSLIPGPVTTKKKAQKKNDVKAKSMLLMELPNEHLMTFNQYKEAKTLFAIIQIRFGGNEATKKTQKTLLKQMYENFKDLNLKILRSLPSEWNTHVVVWRNKLDLDTMSFDDLYNNFKIVEQEVKGTTSSSSNSQNMTFVSFPSSTNEVTTAYGVSTTNTQVSPASTQVSTANTQVSTANLSDDTIYTFLASQPNGSQLIYEDLKQIHEDDIEEMNLKWQLALLSIRTRRFFQKTGRKITINGSDTAGYDKSKNQDSSKRTINVEETSSKAMVAIDGAGFDWSYMADDEVPTNMDLMAFSDSGFNKSEFNLATYKRGLASVLEQLVFYKKNELEKLKQEKESNQLKIEKFDNASKSLDKLIGSQITDKSRKGVRFVSYNVVPPPLPYRVIFTPNLDLSYSGLEEFQQPKFEGYGPKTSKNVSEDTSNEVRESPDAPMVEKLV
ncbi:hypothetical protein Tco_1291519 [Tanacetum coccineum]